MESNKDTQEQSDSQATTNANSSNAGDQNKESSSAACSSTGSKIVSAVHVDENENLSRVPKQSGLVSGEGNSMGDAEPVPDETHVDGQDNVSSDSADSVPQSDIAQAVPESSLEAENGEGVLLCDGLQYGGEQGSSSGSEGATNTVDELSTQLADAIKIETEDAGGDGSGGWVVIESNGGGRVASEGNHAAGACSSSQLSGVDKPTGELAASECCAFGETENVNAVLVSTEKGLDASGEEPDEDLNAGDNGAAAEKPPDERNENDVERSGDLPTETLNDEQLEIKAADNVELVRVDMNINSADETESTKDELSDDEVGQCETREVSDNDSDDVEIVGPLNAAIADGERTEIQGDKKKEEEVNNDGEIPGAIAYLNEAIGNDSGNDSAAGIVGTCNGTTASGAKNDNEQIPGATAVAENTDEDNSAAGPSSVKQPEQNNDGFIGCRPKVRAIVPVKVDNNHDKPHEIPPDNVAQEAPPNETDHVAKEEEQKDQLGNLTIDDAVADDDIMADIATTATMYELIQLDNKDLVENPEQIRCPVCDSFVDQGDGVMLKDCLHSFCRACLQTAIANNKTAVVRCPYETDEYVCQSELFDGEVRALVSTEVYAAHLERSVTEAFDHWDVALYKCRTPNCTGRWELDDYTDRVVCPVCEQPNCLHCQSVHQELTCDGYRAELIVDRDELAAENQQLAAENALLRATENEQLATENALLREAENDQLVAENALLQAAENVQLAAENAPLRGDENEQAVAQNAPLRAAENVQVVAENALLRAAAIDDADGNGDNLVDGSASSSVSPSLAISTGAAGYTELDGACGSIPADGSVAAAAAAAGDDSDSYHSISDATADDFTAGDIANGFVGCRPKAVAKRRSSINGGSAGTSAAVDSSTDAAECATAAEIDAAEFAEAEAIADAAERAAAEAVADAAELAAAQAAAEATESVFGSTHTLQELIELESNVLVPNLDTIECPICFEQVEPGAGAKLKNCLHAFCRQCLCDHIRHNQHAEVKCPYMDQLFSCNETLDDREVRALVPDKVYAAHLERSLSQARANWDGDLYQCKTPDCTMFWELEEGADPIMICPSCQKPNCQRCQAIHEGQTCEDYQEDLQADQEGRERSDPWIRSMKKAGVMIECPNCKANLERIQGCDFVLCIQCKKGICWITKQLRWGPRGEGDTSGGCRCKVGGVKCHPNCGNCH